MIPKESEVPDSIRPYLDEIAERLRAGHAAVMVGAGFSKNADQGFPDWNQLGDLFYQKAHGVKPDSDKQKYLNVLKLAEEVQASFGRPALENLLRSDIPDLNVEPSSLHVELLELPWADVFTTNYDTLLERASANVVTRRYALVVNKEDIPYADKPRIVKLHGSFPSERPFIITEEDYRRYPHDYAPFVNTVQQSLLENTFCLIGFSGDDPNFEQWIGWIRDNLGKDKTQKIYLIGVFDLSTAKLQLLAQRGIIVVDLSCCSGIEKNDHKKALTKFISYMQTKKTCAIDGLLSCDTQTLRPTINQGVNRNDEIKKITEEWRKQRLAYPEWLILPHGNRDTLWRFTESWVSFLPDTEKSTPSLDILYGFELIWRLERCLLPIFSNHAELFEKILEKYWPFQTENPPANCPFRADDEHFNDLSWNDIRQAWLAIALAMLRFYREEGHLEKWKKAENRLTALFGHFSAEQKEFMHYERFLFALFTLDAPNAKQRLENWRPNESQPYWMAKRAAALAEIGLFNEAEANIRDALENIRKKLNQKVVASDFIFESQESNAMLLGKYIQDASAFLRGNRGEHKRTNVKSQDRLKGFEFDPWNELELFKLILDKPLAQRKDVTEKREFDIGRVTRNLHFLGTDQETLKAYSFLRFCEEVGLPFRIGNSVLDTKTAVASLQRISRYSSFWATATLVRIGDVKFVDSLFNRESAYRFTDNDADQLIHQYLEVLNNCRADIDSSNDLRIGNYGARLAQVLPEVISRLCCKSSIEMKRLILAFITELYGSSDKGQYGKVKSLTKRLLGSMSEAEQYSLIPDLLKIPFPENLNLIIKDEFLNPFLFLDVKQKPECVTAAVEIQPEFVDALLKQAMLEDADRRRWAIASLMKLYELQLFNTDQKARFAEAVWFKRDQFGLPDDTNFYKFAYLSLPHPEDVDPARLFKDYVSKAPFPIQGKKKGTGFSIGGGNVTLAHEIIGANENRDNVWTTEDAVVILNRVLEWWDADKDLLNQEEREPVGFSLIAADELRSKFSRIAELIAEVIGPKLGSDSPEDIKASLGRLLGEMQDHGLPVLQAEAVCLPIFPEQKEDILNRVKEALISNQDKIARDGLRAIAKIVTRGGNDAIEPVISMLVQYITWRPARYIPTALMMVVRILNTTPDSLSTDLDVAVQRRLDRLLEETDYRKDNPDLDFDEKLDVRRVIAILAATLWTNYKSRNAAVPCVLEKWRVVCLSPDEFSEIRNAWIDCEKV